MRNTIIILSIFFTLSAQASAVSQVPPNCIVQSWCLESASECKFMRMLNPQGLFQGEAQYAVVRRAALSCRNRYGEWEDKSYHGPVEPVIFRSGVEVDAETARAEAERLCSVYREQWVSVAPRCQ